MLGDVASERLRKISEIERKAWSPYLETPVDFARRRPRRYHYMGETLMIRIGRNPAVISIKFIIIVSAGASLLVARMLSELFNNPYGYALGFLIILVGLSGLIVGIVGMMYRRLAWDPARRLARFGRRTVPLDSITVAWRQPSVGIGKVAYLSYRFVSSDGRSVRVLVTGTPMKGLDRSGMAELARFVSALPNITTGTVNGLTEEQNAIADSITPASGKSRVGTRLLLAELAALDKLAPDGTVADGNAPTAAASNQPENVASETSNARLGAAEQSDRPTITTTEAAALERAWAADDEDAVRFLAERRSIASVPR